MNKIINGTKKLFEFVMKEEILIKIGLILSSLSAILTFILAVYFYLMGSLDKAIFWAILHAGSEVSHVGLKVADYNLKKSGTCTTNITVDVSEANNPEKIIDVLRDRLT